MPDPDDATGGAGGRLGGVLSTARRWTARPAVGRALVAVALVALVVGAIGAVRSMPDDAEVDWRLVGLIALVGTPVTVALNAVEYRLTASAAGVHESVGTAARISIYGTAANLLPIPGGSLVRIEAISRRGVGLGVATSATLAVGLVWLGTSLLMAGLLGLITTPLLAAGFIGGGVVPLVAAWGVFSRIGTERRAVIGIAAVQIAAVTTQAARFWLAIAAIDASPTVGRTFALGVSVTVAAAAGFLPGGLGIREAIAAVLGPLIGLTAAETFLATLLDRVAGLAAICVIAVLVLVATRGHATRLLDESTGNLATPQRRSGPST